MHVWSLLFGVVTGFIGFCAAAYFATVTVIQLLGEGWDDSLILSVGLFVFTFLFGLLVGVNSVRSARFARQHGDVGKLERRAFARVLRSGTIRTRGNDPDWSPSDRRPEFMTLLVFTRDLPPYRIRLEGYDFGPKAMRHYSKGDVVEVRLVNQHTGSVEHMLDAPEVVLPEVPSYLVVSWTQIREQYLKQSGEEPLLAEGLPAEMNAPEFAWRGMTHIKPVNYYTGMNVVWLGAAVVGVLMGVGIIPIEEILGWLVGLIF